MAAASSLPFRDINVHASTSHYAFSSPSSPSAPTLVVERPTGDVRLNDGNLLGTKRVSSIAGILGIIKLRLDKYIVVVTKSKAVGRIRGHMIHKVIATELLPLQERMLKDSDEEAYRSLVDTLLRSAPLFFSYSFDPTNSFQRQSEMDPSVPLWKRADERFFWNRFIQSDLIDLRNTGMTAPGFRHATGQEQPGVDPFILPVIFGMAEIRDTSLKGIPLTFILITRRSRHRGGTRYFSRGLDDHGHVSNYNETEQIVILNDSSSGNRGGYPGPPGSMNGMANAGRKEAQILSYVQTRGSVPVYWAEINTLSYTPTLQVRGVESAVNAAKSHFDEQIRIYGDNYLVNLVNQKGRERRVKEAYEQIVRLLVSSPVERARSDEVTDEKFHIVAPNQQQQEFDRLHYIYFDFHNETKGLKWHRAALLLDQLRNPIINGGYFRGVDLPADAMRAGLDGRRTQRCVVRTNCMDCLDRTNVVQSMLGRFVLTRQLIDLGMLREGEEVSDDAAFEHLFRNVWADNADIVSRAYSGTGALKTDFTRTGNRTKAGMFADFSNSVTRYFKNNFMDGPRQDAFDLVLGAYLPEEYGRAGGGGSIFADRRPLFIQAVPYVLAFALFFVLVGSFTRRGEDTAVWPLRLLMFLALALAGVCFQFIRTYGTLYVNWPRLNTPSYAMEGYQDALAHVQKLPVVGVLAGGGVGQHMRGRSDSRVAYLEEGKKRIE